MARILPSAVMIKTAAGVESIREGTDGPNCSNVFSTNRPTACRPKEFASPVRITHPFHPLFGKEIHCIERRVTYGDDLLFYRDHLGTVTSVPTRWTSAEIEDPFLAVSAGRSYFRVSDLSDLASLIGEIQSALQPSTKPHDV